MLSQDTVSVGKHTVPIQHFLVVKYDGGIFTGLHSSGFIGLSPKNDTKFYGFIQQLKIMRLIESQMFAMKFSNKKNDDTSEITFGEYNPEIIGNNPILWETNTNANKWLLKVKKMSFGDTQLKLRSELVEVATGERNMRLTREDFEPIDKYLRVKFTCTYENANYLFYCFVYNENLADFPNINIEFEHLSLSIPPSEYVEFSIDKKTGKKIAIIEIEVIPSHLLDYNGIGTVVLKNYYTIFDMDNKRIGFAIPQKNNDSGSNTGLILGIVLPILIILLLVGGYFGYRKYKYGTWLGKSTTNITTDQALLASNTL